MKNSRITTKNSLHVFPIIKKVQKALLLLALALGYATVPIVKADLPPETYYQGIDTGVNGDDVGSAALPIGFNFTFFGNTFSQFYVSSNGYITFDNNGFFDYTNDDITDGSNPDNYIAPFWDDVTVYNGQDQYVYYRTIGTAPNRQLIVQFTNVGFWSDPTPLGTFFVILYEGSDNIQMQYRYLVGDNARAHGDEATVGLEGANGSVGTKYSYNTADSLASEQVILFTPNGANYDISTAPYNGVLLGAGATPSPDIPVQTAPLNGSTVSRTPTFTWGASANATSYELRIDNNSNMGSLELNPTGITGTSYTPPSQLAVDTFYWIVIARNADDASWSEQWTFTTSNNPPPPLPSVPLLTSPVQDEVDVSLSPTFSWQTASDADSYQLLVSEQSDLSSPVIDQSGIISPTTSFNATGLTSDTLYYWGVVASNVTGDTQSTTRSFTTLHVNTPPTAVDDSDSVVEDSGTTQIDVLANDTDPDSGDTLSISAVGATDNGGTAVSNAGQIDYTPALNFVGTEVFTYTISDGSSGNDTATVTVTVTDNPTNDPPTAVNDSDSVVEDSGTTQIDVLANDSDPDAGDTLSISAVGATDNGGTAVSNAGQIDYTPALNFVGTEVFTYTISDGNGGSNTATVTVSVSESPINDPPTAVDDSASVVEDSGTTSIGVLANDTDPDAGDTLSISAVGATDNGGTAVSNAGQIDYTPALNFVGTEVFTYTISDGNGGSNTATVTITVTDNPTNDLPTAVDDTDTVVEDSGTTQIDVLANDTDPDAGDTLSISAVGATDNGGTAVSNAGQIDYTPALNFVGTEVFTYTISDGNGGSDTATVTITVTDNPTNDPPTANDDSDTVVEDSGTTQIDVLANDTDPDAGDTVSISAVGATDNGGTAVSNSGQIDYTPATNFVGTEVFTYTISDGNGGSDTATVTITVTDNPTNDPPTAVDDSDTVVEDSGTTQIDILANDSDPDAGDTLSISAVGATNNGGTAVS
ncbi:T1SS secreted agglutinin (RTX), partial [hydrothermal vent metagenome]